MQGSTIGDTFAKEGEELLEDLEEGFLALEVNPERPELVDALFRAAHTLKGNAGMVGYLELVRVTHALEGLLERLRSRAAAVTPTVMEALFTALDQCKVMVESFRRGQPCTGSAENEYALQLLGAAAGTEWREPEAPSLRTFRVTLYFRQDTWLGPDDPMTILDEFGMLGDVRSVTTCSDRVPPLETLDASQCYLGLCIELTTDAGPMGILGLCVLSVDESDIEIVDLDGSAAYDLSQAARAAESALEPGAREENGNGEAAGPTSRARARAGELPARASTTLRVDSERLDHLMDLVGELVIGISQVQARGAAHDAAVRAAAVERLESLGRELQDQVMALRMLPVQDSFERFRRPIRDLAKELGKAVELEISGGETRVDKKVLDQLADPLKHMLRNCVSHGLEHAAERLAAGKPESGTVHLRAQQREGHVVIEIGDDGRGIDPAKVRARAEERGLIEPNQPLTEAQCYELLFLPGFSTADAVSEISGRGVGLDVVRRNVQALRGTVEVSSARGRGTTFRIRLPLTLAIVEGMNVAVGAETVTIPLPSVVELIAPGPRTIRTVEGKHEYVDVRGELLPMLRLSEALGLPGAGDGDAEARVVLVETERRKFGLLVDRVLGMAQTVIKSLDQSYELFGRMSHGYEKPRGVGGAAILGDGNVGIILDVHGLESMTFGGV